MGTEKTLPKKTPGRTKSFSYEEALDAAVRVFGAKGYDATSLADLTDAMGINKPSMYATFGNKEELFRRAMERFSEAGKAHFSAVLGKGTARDGIEALLREGVAKFTNPKLSGISFLTQRPLSDPDTSKETKKFVEKRRAAIELAMRRRIESAVKDGEFPRKVSSERLARFYWVVIQGLALQAQHGGIKKQLFDVVDMAMEKWPG
jgi:AcrR family transcriptional regulator